MLVFIGKYRSHFNTLSLARKILFFKDKNSDEVYRLSDFLMYGNNPPPEKEDWEDLCSYLDRTKDHPTTWLYKFLHKLPTDRPVFVKVNSEDVFSADITLAHIIHPILLKVKEDKPGIPSVDISDIPESLRKSEDNLWVQEHWDYVLDTMIQAFNMIKEGLDEGDDFYDKATVKEGLRLFGKYYQCLWT